MGAKTPVVHILQTMAYMDSWRCEQLEVDSWGWTAGGGNSWRWTAGESGNEALLMEDNDVQNKSCNVIGQHFTVQWLGQSVI